MSNIKHSKFKNTYLMYEFLVRQVMSDVMFGKTKLQESKAFSIINKYFNTKSALTEELKIYNAMINSKFNHVSKNGADFSANYLINECLKRHESLSQKELRTSKYNLVKEIKESYDIDKLFSTPVSNYREGATVYALLEANRMKSPVEKARYSGIMFEHITKPRTSIKENTTFKSEVFKDVPKDELNLAFNMLVKSFNKTYGSVLTENQKKLIQDYVYSSTNESNWINEHFTKARLMLNKKIKSLDKDKQQDKQVVKLKLQECETKLNRMTKEKTHNQDVVLNKIMAVYSLLEMLEPKQ